eukprot:1195695-Prorocentrum_minimum.AAC.4
MDVDSLFLAVSAPLQECQLGQDTKSNDTIYLPLDQMNRTETDFTRIPRISLAKRRFSGGIPPADTDCVVGLQRGMTADA